MYTHPYLTVSQLISCFTFPTFMRVSFVGASGTVCLCRCGKIQKLQIHKINPLGDLLVNNTQEFMIYSAL